MLSRKVVAVILVVLSIHCLSQPAEAGRPFFAWLTGDQEVPPVETEAASMGRVQFLRVGRFEVLFMWRIDVGLSGPLSPVAFGSGAHIHLGLAGENGPVVLALQNEPDIDRGFVQMTMELHTEEELVGPLEGLTLEDLALEMEAGNTYINLHTDLNPTGEIRGQIKRRGL